jgi:hypothetical protein
VPILLEILGALIKMKRLFGWRNPAMRQIPSRLSWIFAAALLLVAAILVSTDRLQYCGQAEPPQAAAMATAVVGFQEPTLAPAQKVVFVRVEADKPDLEVGWMEN